MEILKFLKFKYSTQVNVLSYIPPACEINMEKQFCSLWVKAVGSGIISTLTWST